MIARKGPLRLSAAAMNRVTAAPHMLRIRYNVWKRELCGQADVGAVTARPWASSPLLRRCREMERFYGASAGYAQGQGSIERLELELKRDSSW
jgi:hypothetical protein